MVGYDACRSQEAYAQTSTHSYTLSEENLVELILLH